MTDKPHRLITMRAPAVLVVAVLGLGATVGCGGPGNRFVPDAPAEQLDPLRLRTDLKEMAEANLRLRRRLARATDPHTRSDLADRLEQLEYRQSQRLERIFELLDGRWPSVDLVGAEASRAALIVAQHIDSYRGVQRRALRLLKKAVRNEKAPRSWVAFLTDRVRLSGGHPQLYGTQVNIDGGEVVPRPIVDPETLDERRMEMGLDPMDQYLNRVRDQYGLADPGAGTSDDPSPRSVEGR